MTFTDALITLTALFAVVLLCAGVYQVSRFVAKRTRRYLLRRDLRKMFGGQWP